MSSLNPVRGVDHLIPAAVKELQGLKIDVVAGAAANTNIAVSGAATEDVVVAVLQFDTGVPSKVTGSFTSAGNLRVTTDTTSKTLVVVWYNKK